MIPSYAQEMIDEIREENSNPNGVSVHAQTQTPPRIEEVMQTVADLGLRDEFIVKTVLAVYLSTFVEKKDPVWLMLVGNPSSNKTTLVDLFKDLDDVYRLDTMTANPFSSGQREVEKPQDLLPLLNMKCFIVKEYATILGRSDELVKQLLSDLVAIYDGEYAKHSPTRGTKTYCSYFSHIGCVTPMAIQSRDRYMEMVGARFLYLRIPSLTEEVRQESLDQLWTAGLRSKAEVSALVATFCRDLKERVPLYSEVKFSRAAKKGINSLATLISRARGIIITERTSFQSEDGKEQVHYEATDSQIEEPFRAFKQIKKLTACLALVNGREEVTEEELQIARTIALSSMAVRRADILKAFENAELLTAKQAADSLAKTYKTVKRHLDELVGLKVLQSSKEENFQSRVYSLMPEFKSIINLQSLNQRVDSTPSSSPTPTVIVEEIPF